MSTSKYSYEFKKKCVELYRQNLELPTPNNVSKRSFSILYCFSRVYQKLKGLRYLNHIPNISIGIPRKNFA